MTRRALLFALAVGPRLGRAAGAGEFWDAQEPSQWSEKDIRRLLTKSPWAKQVALEMGAGGMGGPDMGGPGMGPPPGMEGPGGSGIVVRWESAAPVREARKKKLAISGPGSYVISVSDSPILAELGVNFDAAALESARASTFLQRANKKPLAPTRITPSFDEAGVFLYEFPNDSDPITADDKQITFQTKSDLFSAKARFNLKDMLYRGKLAL